MKTLVVYYSLHGNTKKVATKIAQALGADILELKIGKDYPKNFLLTVATGVKDIMIKSKPKLLNDEVDISEYNTIILGTPIWAGTFTPPIASFLDQYKLFGKKVAFFATHRGGGADTCFKKLRDDLSSNVILGEKDFNTKEDYQKRLDEWIEELRLKK